MSLLWITVLCVCCVREREQGMREGEERGEGFFFGGVCCCSSAVDCLPNLCRETLFGAEQCTSQF